MDAQVELLVHRLQQIPGIRISIESGQTLISQTTSPTFGDWATSWLNIYKRGIVKDNTFYGTYQDPVDLHLIPHFGDYALASIRPEDVQIYFKSLSSTYSLETQKKIRNAMKQIYETAIECGHCQFNPVTRSLRLTSSIKPVEKHTWTLEEYNTAYQFALHHPHGLPVILLMETAISRSELLGLRWSDHDSKKCVLNINSGLVCQKSTLTGKYELVNNGLKNQYRQRSIPLSPLVNGLLYLKPREIFVKEKGQSSRKVKTEFIFHSPKGTAYDPDNWYRRVLRGFMKVNFDELDFYCFIEFFEAKELISLFSKNHIETIEFKNIDAIETAVHNILNYYEAIQKQLPKSIEVLRLQTQIKTCLALLRYTDISQALVERLCMFIFKYDFRDILINDKVMFLNGQLAQRNKYSSITAKIIEDKLIWYIDSHIHALKIGKPFDSLSTNSTINYSDLVRYVARRDMQYHSYRLSIRISEIIKSDLSSLFPHIVEYYWAYISTSQRRRVVTWAKAKLAENFSFDLLMLLLECNARIGESIISSLKEYLSTSIEKSLKATEHSNGISFPRNDPYQELNQVGYWCLIKTLPPKFSEFVGYSDSFDFYYLYKKFDFKKFNAAWLLNLYPHTLEAIAKDIKVKNKIRFVIADTLNREKLTESDQTKLLSILTGYFC